MPGSGDEDFAFFRLAGDRFEAPGMPTDAAEELIRFRDAVYAVARTRWLEQNFDRRRVPNGFERAFDLRLVGISEGSARPRINLHRDQEFQDAEYDPWFEIYRRARDEVVGGLAGVATTHELPASFPAEDIKFLRRLGGSLDEGDGVSIGPPGQEDAPKVLDRQVRDTLRRIGQVLSPDATEVEVEGVITEFDGERQSFQLRRTIDGGPVTCRFPHYESALARRVKAVLAEDGVTAPDVLVRGQTQQGAQGRVSKITGVWDVEVVRTFAEKAYMRRFESLDALQDGWWGEGSMAPDPAVLQLIDQHRGDFISADVDVTMAAHPDGSVELDWRRDTLEFSVVLGARDGMSLCIDHLDTDELEEAELPIDWTVLSLFLLEGRWQ